MVVSVSMKRKTIVIGILGIIVAVILLFLFLIFLHIIPFDFQEQVLKAQPIEKPQTYITMTEQQLQEFPHLKEAILTGRIIRISWDEARNLLDFFGNKDHYIKYNDQYYEIMIGTT